MKAWCRKEVVLPEAEGVDSSTHPIVNIYHDFGEVTGPFPCFLVFSVLRQEEVVMWTIRYFHRYIIVSIIAEHLTTWLMHVPRSIVPH